MKRCADGPAGADDLASHVVAGRGVLTDSRSAHLVGGRHRLMAVSSPMILPLPWSEDAVESLSSLLVETVANGGSVSFMHPLPLEVARAFWTRSLQAAAAGERVVLGAFVDKRLVATVTLLLDCPPNQPHRGEIAKMMTSVAYRGRGIARMLVLEAERIACAHGRWLLTLDTAEDEGAGPFYEKLGFLRVGVIPDYAYKPHGGLCGTVIYYKRL